jgi:hypothetical protein
MIGASTTVMLPIIGIVFAALFAWVFQQSWITGASARVNALLRIVFAIMWIIASMFIVLVIFVVAVINWLYQLIMGQKDIGITEKLVNWWLEWTKVIVYGYN